MGLGKPHRLRILMHKHQTMMNTMRRVDMIALQEEEGEEEIGLRKHLIQPRTSFKTQKNHI